MCLRFFYELRYFIFNGRKLEKKELDLSHFEIHEATDKIGRESRNLQSFSDVGESDGI